MAKKKLTPKQRVMRRYRFAGLLTAIGRYEVRAYAHPQMFLYGFGTTASAAWADAAKKMARSSTTAVKR